MKTYVVYTQHLMPTESGFDVLGVFASHPLAQKRMEEEMASIVESWDDGTQSLNVDIDPDHIHIEHVDDEIPWADIYIEEFDVQE